MTQEEIKKLDKQINAVQNPFGNGYASLRKILKMEALQKDTTMSCVLQEYLDWKSSHHRL